MEYMPRQDMFDSQATLSPTQIGILMGFSKIWEKHESTIEKVGMTDAVFADYKKLANKFDVEYETPRKSESRLTVVH